MSFNNLHIPPSPKRDPFTLIQQDITNGTPLAITQQPFRSNSNSQIHTQSDQAPLKTETRTKTPSPNSGQNSNPTTPQKTPLNILQDSIPESFEPNSLVHQQLNITIHPWKPPTRPFLHSYRYTSKYPFAPYFTERLLISNPSQSMDSLSFYMAFQTAYFKDESPLPVPRRMIQLSKHHPNGSFNFQFDLPVIPESDSVLNTFQKLDQASISHKNYFSVIKNNLHINTQDIPHLLKLITLKTCFTTSTPMELDTLDQNYQTEEIISDTTKKIYCFSSPKMRLLAKPTSSSFKQLPDEESNLLAALNALSIIKYCFTREQLLPYTPLLISRLVPLLIFPNHGPMSFSDMIMDILQRIMCPSLISYSFSLIELLRPVPDLIDVSIDLRCYLIDLLSLCCKPVFEFAWARPLRNTVIKGIEARLRRANEIGHKHNFYTCQDLNFVSLLALGRLGAFSHLELVKSVFSTQGLLADSDSTQQTQMIIESLLKRQFKLYSGMAIMSFDHVNSLCSGFDQILVGADYTWPDLFALWEETTGGIVSSSFSPFALGSIETDSSESNMGS